MVCSPLRCLLGKVAGGAEGDPPGRGAGALLHGYAALMPVHLILTSLVAPSRFLTVAFAPAS